MRDDQEEAGTGEAATGKLVYPAILETLRGFWVEFVASADGRDLNAYRATGQVFRALEFEVVGHIRLRVAQEQIGEEIALVEQIEDEDEEEHIGDYDKIIEDFLSAANHWQQASDSLELCAVCQTIAIAPEALSLACMQQRLQLFRLMTSIMEKRCTLQRARLRQAGHQEILFL